MHHILVSDTLSEKGLALLREKARVDYLPGLKPERLLEIIGRYDALIVRSGTKVTATVLEAGRNLKVVGRAGSGVDNIDVEKATERGIMVINTPGANTISTAEHTVAMLTALARNIPAAHNTYRSGSFQRDKFVGVELAGKKLGIIGLGRIGSEVARRARSMRMRLMAYDPYIAPERAEKMGVEPVALETLLREADFITLHVPLVAATRHMIGEKEFALMKPGVRLINCARGGLVCEEALCRALEEGKVAGAALDVFENDNPRENRLFSMDNVIVTPHLGASTFEAQENVAVQVADQVLKALQGEPVASAVNVPGFSDEVMAEVEPYLPLMHLLGSFLMQLFGGSVEEVEIHYSGEIAARPLAPLTTTCLIGILQTILGEQANYVNAPHLIKNRGIKVKEFSTSSLKSYTNHVAVKVKSGERAYTVAGTLLDENDIRIVQINGYIMDVVPSRYMLITTHYDRPGVVGHVGTILGSEKINIAGMQLGRQAIGGEAIMVIQVDVPVPQAVIEKINAFELMLSTRFVELVGQDLIKRREKGTGPAPSR
ncbi:MAG: phosphoglycerate dehydrogenase [Firmicutes bacterium]|nr:phosphoglycerate dehydrogenase [Bacillota bacterium]